MMQRQTVLSWNVFPMVFLSPCVYTDNCAKMNCHAVMPESLKVTGIQQWFTPTLPESFHNILRSDPLEWKRQRVSTDGLWVLMTLKTVSKHIAQQSFNQLLSTAHIIITRMNKKSSSHIMLKLETWFCKLQTNKYHTSLRSPRNANIRHDGPFFSHQNVIQVQNKAWDCAYQLQSTTNSLTCTNEVAFTRWLPWRPCKPRSYQ